MVPLFLVMLLLSAPASCTLLQWFPTLQPLLGEQRLGDAGDTVAATETSPLECACAVALAECGDVRAVRVAFANEHDTTLRDAVRLAAARRRVVLLSPASPRTATAPLLHIRRHNNNSANDDVDSTVLFSLQHNDVDNGTIVWVDTLPLCVDRRTELSLTVALWTAALIGTATATLRTTTASASPLERALPLLTLLASYATPYALRYATIHIASTISTGGDDVAIAVVHSGAPVTRAPLVLLLLALRIVAPPLIVAVALARAAPDVAHALPGDTRAAVALALGCACEAAAARMAVHGVAVCVFHVWHAAIFFFATGALAAALQRCAASLSARESRRAAGWLFCAYAALVAMHSASHAATAAIAAAAAMAVALMLAAHLPRGPARALQPAAADVKDDDVSSQDDCRARDAQCAPATLAALRQSLHAMPLVGERAALIERVRATYATLHDTPDANSENTENTNDAFRFVVVRGARGHGKSRLVAELRAHSHTLVGHCGESACAPFAPLREALGALMGSNRFTTQSQQLALIGGIGELVDSAALAIVFGIASSSSTSSTSGANGDTARLAHAIVHALCAEQTRLLRGARRRRVVLVLEDVQHIDGDSVDVLRGIVAAARNVSSTAFTLLLTHRDNDDANDDADAVLPAWLVQLEPDQCVALEPLAERDVRALLARLGFCAAFVRAAARPLHALTRGSPLRVALVLDALDGDTLVRDGSDGTWALAEGKFFSSLALPGALAGAVAAKLAALRDAALVELLQIAALLGPVFDFDVLVAALARPEADCARALLRLERDHGLVHECDNDDGGGGGLFAFSSGAYVDAARPASGSQLERCLYRAIGAAVGRVLAARPGTPPLALLVQRADALLRGGSGCAAEARAAAEEACRAAMACWHLSAAIEYGAAAVRLGSVDATLRLDLCKAYLGRNPYADHALARHAIAPMATSAPPPQGTLAVELHVQMALCCAYAGTAEALEEALQWCARVPADADRLARANALWAKGFALFKSKRPDDAIAALSAGLALWDGDGDDASVAAPADVEIYCKLLNVSGSVYLSLNRFADAEAALGRTIAIAERTQSNPLGRAIALGLSGRAILRRVAASTAKQHAYADDETRALVLDARARFRANDELSKATGSIAGLLINPASLGECARLLRDWRDLLASGELLVHRALLYGDVSARAIGQCLQAEALLALGEDVERARALCATVRDALPTLPADKVASVRAALGHCGNTTE